MKKDETKELSEALTAATEIAKKDLADEEKSPEDLKKSAEISRPLDRAAIPVASPRPIPPR